MLLNYRGFILSDKKIFEADKEYTVYMDELGKIPVTAQGIRKPTSKLASNMQYFALIDLSVYKGKKYRLTGGRVANLYRFKSQEQIYYGLYFLELVDKMTAYYNPTSGVCDLADNFFDKLEKSDSAFDLKFARLVVVLKLLNIFGYNIVNKNRKDASSVRDINYLTNLNFDYLWDNKESVRSDIDFKGIFSTSQKVLEEVLETKILSDSFLRLILNYGQ